MRIGPGAVTLADITNGELSVGTVPYDRFKRIVVGDRVGSGFNVSAGAVGTNFSTLDCGTVVLNDIIWGVAQVKLTNGAVGVSDMELRLFQFGGTANIEWYTSPGLDYLQVRQPQIPVSEIVILSLMGMGIITVAGTLDVRAKALSYDQDATGAAIYSGASVFMFKASE